MVDLIQTILNSAVEMLIKFKDKKQIFPSKVKRYTIPLHSSSCNLLTKGYLLLLVSRPPQNSHKTLIPSTVYGMTSTQYI